MITAKDASRQLGIGPVALFREESPGYGTVTYSDSVGMDKTNLTPQYLDAVTRTHYLVEFENGKLVVRAAKETE